MSSFPWYRNTRGATPIRPEVAQRALEWLVELQSGHVTPDVVQAWTRWRAAHPEHEQAWLRIESVKGKLQPLSAPHTSAIAQATLVQPASEHRRRALKAMLGLAVTAGVVWRAGEYAPWREWSADHHTKVGERRELSLPDGTRLQLNTNSAIDIAFTEAERRVKLIAGEILVTTAHESFAVYRPFLVETTQGTARALGTEFAVRHHDGTTQVSVFEGSVQIEPRLNAAQALVLRAGMRADYSDRIVQPAGAAEESSVAWKEGYIVARGMRLDDFLAELGRYSGDALSCDPALAGLRLSGSFPVNDIGRGLAAVAVTLNLRVETETRLWRGKLWRLVPAPVRS